MQDVHIGKEIKKEVERQKISIAEFGRKINLTDTAAASVFKRKGVNTEQLVKISRVLNHDFFEYFRLQAEEKNIIVVDVQIAFSKEELQRYIKASETGEKIEFKRE